MSFLSSRNSCPAAISSQGDVNMRVLRIVMNHGYPFQGRADVLFESRHKVARELVEVEALSELRREDQLEQARVAGRLPFPEPLRKAVVRLLHFKRLILSNRGVALQIAAMRSPLAFGLVR